MKRNKTKTTAPKKGAVAAAPTQASGKASKVSGKAGK